MNKQTAMKKWENSTQDKAQDKKRGDGEGTPADNKQDAKGVAKLMDGQRRSSTKGPCGSGMG